MNYRTFALAGVALIGAAAAAFLAFAPPQPRGPRLIPVEPPAAYAPAPGEFGGRIGPVKLAEPPEAAPDLKFADAMGKVPLRVYYGPYDDETSELSHWHVPQSHYLESWGDIRAFDGTVSIIQPLIAPLYATRSPHEMLAVFGPTPEKSGYDIVRASWLKRTGLGVPEIGRAHV